VLFRPNTGGGVIVSSGQADILTSPAPTSTSMLSTVKGFVFSHVIFASVTSFFPGSFQRNELLEEWFKSMYAMTDIRLPHICLKQLLKWCCVTGSDAVMRYQKENRQKYKTEGNG
jgi:hypothetical protein